MGYVPEIDNSRLLDTKCVNYYQSLIGVLQSCIEIGRIGLCTDISLLYAYIAVPREEHLAAALHVTARMGQNHHTHT